MHTNTLTERTPKRNQARANFLHGHDEDEGTNTPCENPHRYTVFHPAETEALARRV